MSFKLGACIYDNVRNTVSSTHPGLCPSHHVDIHNGPDTAIWPGRLRTKACVMCPQIKARQLTRKFSPCTLQSPNGKLATHTHTHTHMCTPVHSYWRAKTSSLQRRNGSIGNRDGSVLGRGHYFNIAVACHNILCNIKVFKPNPLANTCWQNYGDS